MFGVAVNRNLKKYWNIIYCRHYAKDIKFGNEVRRLMLEGVNVSAKSVAVTMGPKGKNVIYIEKFGKPVVTKDGYTVARHIKLKNKFANVGSQLLLQVANHANNDAGDGTSTATVLARAIAKEAHEAVSRGKNPNEIRKGILLAVECVSKELKKMSKPVQTAKEIMQMATIAAGGDIKMGKIISEAISKVGAKGIIQIVDGNSPHDNLKLIQGFHFESGYTSPYFINTEKGSKIILKDPYILIVNRKISSARPLLPCLELAKKKNKPLLIIADEITGEALSIMVLNKLHNGLDLACVKSPSFGTLRTELMMDLAISTGATLYDETNTKDILVSKALEADLGCAGEVVIDKNSTLILDPAVTLVEGEIEDDNGQRRTRTRKYTPTHTVTHPIEHLGTQFKGNKNLIQGRIAELQNELERSTKHEIAHKLHERIGKMSTGVALIEVGGYGEIEMNTKKDRYCDAVNATKAAIEEGVIAGGGTALIKTIQALELLKIGNRDQRLGVQVIKNAIKSPCKVIAENSNIEDSNAIISKVLKEPETVGFDVMTNRYTDLMAKGVIDSTKVVITALKKAASVASLLGTVEAVIINLPKEQSRKRIFRAS